MDKTEFDTYLCQVAQEVDSLVNNPQAKNRFVEQIQIFLKMAKEFLQRKGQVTDAQDKLNNFPTNPLKWFSTGGLQIGDGDFGDLSDSKGQRKPTEQEILICQYVRLAAIHDHICSSVEDKQIYFDPNGGVNYAFSFEGRIFGLVFSLIAVRLSSTENYDNDKRLIDKSLQAVKSDLKRLLQETQRQTRLHQESPMLDTFKRWKRVADNGVDDIGHYRKYGHWCEYEFKMPEDFRRDTTTILSLITKQYPQLDPAPLQTIYHAIEAWYKDHDALRSPPQNELESVLELAMQLVLVLEDHTIQRVYEKQTVDQPLTPASGARRDTQNSVTGQPEKGQVKGISKSELAENFRQRMTANKQRQYSIEYLLELIDTYDVVRRSQAKVRLTPDGVQKTDFHTIAELNYNELFDYAVKIKTQNSDLPDVPEPSGDPDKDVTRLRQWTVNVQNLLSGKKSDGGKAGDTQNSITGQSEKGQVKMTNSELLLQLAEKLRIIREQYVNFIPQFQRGESWEDVFADCIKRSEKVLHDVEDAISATSTVGYKRRDEILRSLIRLRNATTKFLPNLKLYWKHKPVTAKENNIGTAVKKVSEIIESSLWPDNDLKDSGHLLTFADDLEVAGELEQRGENTHANLAVAPLPDNETKKTSGTAGDTKKENTPSADFTSVLWNGTRYQFNKTQAECIRLLWQEYKKGTITLSEKTIGEAIDSADENFRLIHVFRKHKGGGMHPAWEKMITSYGKGIYGLAVNSEKKLKSRKNPT